MGVKRVHFAPFFIMKNLLLLCFVWSFSLHLQGQQTAPFIKNDSVLIELLPVNKGVNFKKVSPILFSEKLNILAFADIINVEGLIYINHLKDYQKKYPQIQFVLFHVGPNLPQTEFALKNFCNLYQPNFPVIYDSDSSYYKGLNVTGTPSIFVFEPTKKFIGQMQTDDLPNMLEPFLTQLTDSVHVENSTKEIHIKNNFKNKKPHFSKFSAESDTIFWAVNQIEPELVKINLKQSKVTENIKLHEITQPYAIAYFNDSLLVSDTYLHNIYNISIHRNTSIKLGNSTREKYRMQQKDFQDALNFPTQILVANNSIYSTLSGAYQIWEFPLNGSRQGFAFAGDAQQTGYFKDGFRYESSLKYPVDIEKIGNTFFFIDAKFNIIRKIERGYVSTPGFNAYLDLINPTAMVHNQMQIFILDGLTKKVWQIELFSGQAKEIINLNEQKGIKDFHFPTDIYYKYNELIILFDRSNYMGIWDFSTKSFNLTKIK